MQVIRNPKHRNYVPKSVYKNNIYYAYCSGGGYILNKKHLKCLFKASKTVKMFRNEDAYMGTLAHFCKINPKGDKRFLFGIFSKIPPFEQDFCQSKNAFVIHGIRKHRQIAYYTDITYYINNPQLCS